MGMLGNYIAVGEDELKRIRSGEIDIFDMNPEEHRMLDIDKCGRLCIICCAAT